MHIYTVVKSLNWLNEVDEVVFSSYAEAMDFVQANHIYITDEFAPPLKVSYELEEYEFDVEHPEGVSKYRSFFLDYANGSIDWEFEIIEG